MGQTLLISNQYWKIRGIIKGNQQQQLLLAWQAVGLKFKMKIGPHHLSKKDKQPIL